MIFDNKDISLDILADKYMLSVRTVNVCRSLGLLSLGEIIKFYQEKGTFRIARNCGRITEKELLELCKKYQNLHPEVISDIKNDTLLLINQLNPLKKSILNKHVEYLISNLNSVRAKHILLKMLENGSIKLLLETIYDPEFRFKKHKKIGDKTIDDFLSFRSDISRFLQFLLKIEDEQLHKEYTKLVVKASHQNLSNEFDAKFESIFDNNGKIMLFKLLNLLFDFNPLLSIKEKTIIKKFYYLNQGSYVYQNIAKELGLTRERIRQLTSEIEYEVQNYIHFILNFKIEDLVNYEMDMETPLKIIDSSFCEKINTNENVSFNTRFYSVIFKFLFKKTHSVLGDDETLNGKKRIIKGNKYKCNYLIRNDFFHAFQFESLIENINYLLNQKVIETYTLHFEGYIFQFLQNDHKYLLREISQICETIILNEYDLVVNFDGYLTIERNIKKPLHEYAIEVLNCNGTKMKVEEITKEINLKNPEVSTTDQSVRATLQREKKIFIYFGRSSTYGLKKWEAEHENIKGGTIRDIVEELLQKSDNPLHISEILKYVRKYRNTNERSLITNLEVEEKKRFIIFDGDFIGLLSKNYGLETFKYQRLIGAHFTKRALKKFDGTELEKVILYFINKCGYSRIQIEHLIEKKVKEGYLEITNNKKLLIK